MRPLPHEAVDGVVQAVDGGGIAVLHRVHDAVGDVIFQDHAAGGVQRRDHGGQLHQHRRAVLAPFHHAAHRVKMTLCAAEPVQHRLGMGVGMGMAVAVTVGVGGVYDPAKCRFLQGG